MTYYKEINGRIVFFKNPLVVGDRQIFNPTEEMLLEQGWQIYVPPVVPPMPQTEPDMYDVMEAVKKMLSTETYTLSDKDALAVAALYPTWISKVGEAVNVGERYWYDGNLYKVIQAHTVQEDWTPDVSTSLFAIVSIEEWPEWKQPIGSEDAYMEGDKITFEGNHYISLINYNIYSPVAYPAGWQIQ